MKEVCQSVILPERTAPESFAFSTPPVRDGVVDYLWIGFNSSTSWNDFLSLHEKFPNSGSIGGRVVIAPQNPLGFYFDPNTTEAGEIVAEAYATSLDLIKENPANFANASHAWFVVPITEKIR